MFHDAVPLFSGISSLPLSKTLAATAIVILIAGLVALFEPLRALLRPLFSPLRELQGPGKASILFGHLREIRKSSGQAIWQEEQLEKYGHVLVYKGPLNQNFVMTTDTRALHHVITNSNTYLKLHETRYNVAEVLGEGILSAEGDDHKRQRRIMNPAFSPIHLRDMTKIFLNKALELRDAFVQLSTGEKMEEFACVEVASYLSSTTLDIIGLAGFDYSFNSLQSLRDFDSNETELSTSFTKIVKLLEHMTFLVFLKTYIPALRLFRFDSRSNAIRQTKEGMRAVGRRLLKEKRQALQHSWEKGGTKDLLTLLIQANTNDRAENGGRNMSDEEVMAQIPSFLLAGHETTATAMTWALYSLSTHPEIQTRLRQELSMIPNENPSMDELNSLDYMDCFTREVLRFHSIAPATARVAAYDDVIPLNNPFIDKYGNRRHEIRVAKGDGIAIPIRMINRSLEIWGTDADKFNPNRWLNPPRAAANIPGVWGNQLSFMGGPHACIGFRFSLVEMKALLFVLIRSFEFKLAVPEEEITLARMTLITRPVLRSEPEKGTQLPLLIKPINTAEVL